MELHLTPSPFKIKKTGIIFFIYPVPIVPTPWTIEVVSEKTIFKMPFEKNKHGIVHE